jgi:hypothetical protein
MNLYLKAAIASLIFAAAANAHADIQEYAVSEIFNDGVTVGGATFNGTFNFDTTTLQLTNLQGVLTDANGTSPLAVIYGPVTGQYNDPTSTYETVVNDPSTATNLFLSLVVNNANPTIDTGSSIYGDYSTLGSNFLFGTETSATITAVPLPSALPLLASGLIGLGAFARKRTQA